MRPYRANPTLVAVRHIRPIAHSAMQAQLYACSDGHRYVLKLPGNKQGRRCIANDFIATQLAKRLGLPVLDSSFVHVMPELLPDSHQYPDHANLKHGIAWGTRFRTDLSEPETPEDLRKLRQKHLIPLVIAFDHWIFNWDRADKVANLLLSKGDGERDWYLIDHGIAFATPEFVKDSLAWTPDLLSRFQTHTHFSYRGELYSEFVPYVKGKNPFGNAIAQIRTITETSILELLNVLPQYWNITSEEKEAFAATLVTRAQHLPEILSHSKDYYTYWKS
jgi:hypothetical protein